MRAVIQRVGRATVTVDGKVVGRVGRGLVILIGVSEEDGIADAKAIAAKIASLRIFADDTGLMNRSVLDVGGEALVISQFTLYGDVRRGRRPSFVDAARPEAAAPLIDHVSEVMRSLGIAVSEGSFGAHMEVELVNDGPVTLVIETHDGRIV